MDYYKQSLLVHKKNKGKLKVVPKVDINSKEDLSVVYTPGVAAPCLDIYNNPKNLYTYTSKSNTVAVVSDGSAVLGLGNIGAAASVPVMEGKAALFKKFADIDAIPICINTQENDLLIKTISLISTTFGGINLEDINAPRCFYIEEKLNELLDIPVFHDDQHGTAIVVCAALINALKVAGKKLKDIKVVICGAGAAGTAIGQNLVSLGCQQITICDKNGIVHKHSKNINPYLLKLLNNLRPSNIKGGVKEAVRGCDVFIGVSAPKVLDIETVQSMNDKAIVFALANPEPEISPVDAKEGGAFIVGTGRSDFPNQINNLLAFPGVFRGALDSGANRITKAMKIAATYALASCIEHFDLNVNHIIPSVFDKNVVQSVSYAVKKAWLDGLN